VNLADFTEVKGILLNFFLLYIHFSTFSMVNIIASLTFVFLKSTIKPVLYRWIETVSTSSNSFSFCECVNCFLELGGQLVLTEQQREEKKAAEAELAFSKSELEKEVDPVKSKLLREEVIYMEKKLDELLLSFEVCHFTVIYVRSHGFSTTVLHL